MIPGDSCCLINSSPPSATFMCQSMLSLVQVMACGLFGAKPLPEPMLAYCQLDSWEQISLIFESEFCHFHSRKCIWKCRLPIWQPFCPGGDELSPLLSYFSMNDGHLWDSEVPLSINPTHIWVRGKQPYIIISNCRVGKCWSFPHNLCQHMQCWNNMCISLRDGSWRCSCFVTWFCYLLIAKSGNKTAAPPWPEPLYIRC